MHIGRGKDGNATVGLTLAEVIHAYGLEGPKDKHHGGAKLLQKNASPRFLGTGIENVNHEAFKAELTDYISNRPSLRSSGLRYVTDFNRLMKWALERGFRRKPFSPFPVPDAVRTVPAPLSPREVQALLGELDSRYEQDLEWRIAIRALLILGLELSEARRFDYAKARKMKGYYLHCDQRGRLRRIPIPLDMQVLIARVQHTFEPGSGPPAGIRISAPDLAKRIRILGTHAGIENLTPQRLQQTAIHGE